VAGQLLTGARAAIRRAGAAGIPPLTSHSSARTPQARAPAAAAAAAAPPAAPSPPRAPAPRPPWPPPCPLPPPSAGGVRVCVCVLRACVPASILRSCHVSKEQGLPTRARQHKRPGRGVYGGGCFAAGCGRWHDAAAPSPTPPPQHPRRHPATTDLILRRLRARLHHVPQLLHVLPHRVHHALDDARHGCVAAAVRVWVWVRVWVVFLLLRSLVALCSSEAGARQHTLHFNAQHLCIRTRHSPPAALRRGTHGAWLAGCV